MFSRFGAKLNFGLVVTFVAEPLCVLCKVLHGGQDFHLEGCAVIPVSPAAEIANHAHCIKYVFHFQTAHIVF